MISDIKNEIQRVRKLVCRFCRKKHANLGCCEITCRYTYHLSCGRKNNVSFEFCNHYPSYCKAHKKFKTRKIPKRESTCGICFETVKSKEHPILIPCCKNSWFHQLCLQKFANTSGVFFKCPLCNDKTTCIKKLSLRGIFIPDKDADWELDFHSWEDFLEVEKVCDSENCLMTAESYQEDPWNWKICSTCGASHIHELCISDSSSDFVCRSCTEILNRPKDKESSPKKSSKKKCQSSFSENELLSSDNDTESEPASSNNEYSLRSKVNTSNYIQQNSIFNLTSDDDTSEEESEEDNFHQSKEVQSMSRQLKSDPFVPLFSDDEEVLSDDDLHRSALKRKCQLDKTLITSMKRSRYETRYQCSARKRAKFINEVLY